MANKDLIVNSGMTKEQKVIGLLVCTGQELKVELERRITPQGLSLLQLNILDVLDHAPEQQLTVNELKTMMIDESPNVSRTLNKLVDAGLVVKERSTSDQRIVYVSITRAGIEKHQMADEEVLSVSLGLSEKEQDKLYDLLLKLSTD